MLDHEPAVHIGLTKPQFRIEQDRPLPAVRGEADRNRRTGAISIKPLLTAGGGNGEGAFLHKAAEYDFEHPVHMGTYQNRPFPERPYVNMTDHIIQNAGNRFQSHL